MCTNILTFDLFSPRKILLSFCDVMRRYPRQPMTQMTLSYFTFTRLSMYKCHLLITGWCSAHPRLSIEKYGIPCQTLTLGDICLPPNHPEAVRTPDLCDRFRRFEFNEDFSGNSGASPLARSVTTSALVNRVVKSNQMSPPMSPAKKKESNAASNKDLSNGGDQAHKPKRPMNGFMLFAKKFRLELIQQHPGKDNRYVAVR